jgi:hypothetical protein
MNKKLLTLICVIGLLLIVAGVASAMPLPGERVYIDPDTSLEVACRDGVVVANVDNGHQPPIVYITCYSGLPPVPER